MVKKKPSESPDDKYVGFVKTIGKEKFAVTMCGGKKTWKKFWPKASPYHFTLEEFFLFKPQLNFKKSFIDHLTASQKKLILEKTNKKLASALRNADVNILFDIIILPQSDHEIVDWWTDYAHSFLTQKYQCKEFNYDQMPYVYVEYRIEKSGKLSPDDKIIFYSKMNKKIQRDYYKPILDKIFEKSEIKPIKNHGSGLDTIQLVVRSSSEADVVRPEEDREGCRDKSHIKKYNTRPSPPYPANECKGKSMKGNDGKIYVSKSNKNGVHRWVKKK